LGLAAFFAAGHDGGVEALAEVGGQVVDFVGTIDLDGFAGGAEGDLAVLATAQMFLQVSAHFGGYRIVDQIIEQSEKLSAGHFSTPFFLRK
jgi:hypothetical protein